METISVLLNLLLILIIAHQVRKQHIWLKVDNDTIKQQSNTICALRRKVSELQKEKNSNEACINSYARIVDALTKEGKKNAIDGQSALDEANNRIMELIIESKVNKGLYVYYYNSSLKYLKEIKRQRWQNKKKWEQIQEHQKINEKALQQLGYQKVVLNKIQNLQELSTRPSKLRTYLKGLLKASTITEQA